MDPEPQTSESKSTEELQADLAGLKEQLYEAQVKFLLSKQEQEIRAKQAENLKVQAHDLSEKVNAEEAKLDIIEKQAEEQVQLFVRQMNHAVEKNRKRALAKLNENGETRRVKEKEFNERRKNLYALKAEISALILYKQYQECVIDELEKLSSN